VDVVQDLLGLVDEVVLDEETRRVVVAARATEESGRLVGALVLDEELERQAGIPLRWYDVLVQLEDPLGRIFHAEKRRLHSLEVIGALLLRRQRQEALGLGEILLPARAQLGGGEVLAFLGDVVLLHIELGGEDPSIRRVLRLGFVGAAEAKEALIASGLPAIVVRGRKGGSAMAAAAVNALASDAE